MPIVFNKKTGWTIQKPTPEEIDSLVEIGKMMIVKGLGGAYTNEQYREWLASCPDAKFFKT